MFDPVIANEPVINICIESTITDKNKLSDYLSIFTNKLVYDYYYQNQENNRSKISIYQLYIDYEIEVKKKIIHNTLNG